MKYIDLQKETYNEKRIQLKKKTSENILDI